MRGSGSRLTDRSQTGTDNKALQPRIFFANLTPGAASRHRGFRRGGYRTGETGLGRGMSRHRRDHGGAVSCRSPFRC
jgi:hypothetical protein